MKTIKIYEGKIIHEIQLSAISYFMADGKRTKVFLEDNTCLVSTKILKHYHEQLHNKERFFRVHRKYLINIDHIVSVSDEKKDVRKFKLFLS